MITTTQIALGKSLLGGYLCSSRPGILLVRKCALHHIISTEYNSSSAVFGVDKAIRSHENPDVRAEREQSRSWEKQTPLIKLLFQHQ